MNEIDKIYKEDFHMKKSVLLGLGAVALGATAAIVAKKILDSEPVGDDELFDGSDTECTDDTDDTEVSNEEAKDVSFSHLNEDDFVDEEDIVKLTKPMTKDVELETPPAMVEQPIVAPATESVLTEDVEDVEDKVDGVIVDDNSPEDITEDMAEPQKVEPVQEQPSKVLGESVTSETPAVSKVLHDLEQAADKAEQ